MRRALIPAAVALIAASLLGGVATAQEGTIDVSLDCYGSPERVTVTNNTASALTVAGIQSIDDPQAAEAFRPETSLAAGQSVTYEAGPGATSNRLTGQPIFDEQNPSEGVVVLTSAGQVVVRCTQGAESVAAGQPPADAPPPGTLPGSAPAEPTVGVAVVGQPTPGPGEVAITEAPGQAGTAPAQAPAQVPVALPKTGGASVGALALLAASVLGLGAGLQRFLR